MTEEITSEVDLFGLIMQQNVIENELNREYAPLTTIKPGAAIEFTVKGSNEMYLDVNNSHLHVLGKITKADGTKNDANTAAPFNLTLHSIFREIAVEFNGRNVGDTSQLYPYRSIMESVFNYCKETQESRLLCEGWTKDTTGHMAVTAVGGNNAGLNTRAAIFARSTVVELIGRHHVDVFHHDLLFPPNFDLNKVDEVPEQLCVQVGCAGWKCGARELQASHPERQSYHSYQNAHQHGPRCAHAAPPTAEYETPLFARPNEAPVHPREPDVNQLRQRFYRRHARLGHS